MEYCYSVLLLYVVFWAGREWGVLKNRQNMLKTMQHLWFFQGNDMLTVLNVK